MKDTVWDVSNNVFAAAAAVAVRAVVPVAVSVGVPVVVPGVFPVALPVAAFVDDVPLERRYPYSYGRVIIFVRLPFLLLVWKRDPFAQYQMGSLPLSLLPAMFCSFHPCCSCVGAEGMP